MRMGFSVCTVCVFVYLCVCVYLGKGIRRGKQHILWFQITVNYVLKV